MTNHGAVRECCGPLFSITKEAEKSMWNCDWEYQNQDIMKKNYDRQLSGQYKPVTPIRKIICEGCGCVFYTRIWSKKYCYYKKCGNIGYRKQLRQRRLTEPLRTQVCKMCGKVFTPKRSDALYCSNACRQRAYRQGVTDKTSGQNDHLLEP